MRPLSNVVIPRTLQSSQSIPSYLHRSHRRALQTPIFLNLLISFIFFLSFQHFRLAVSLTFHILFSLLYVLFSFLSSLHSNTFHEYACFCCLHTLKLFFLQFDSLDDVLITPSCIFLINPFLCNFYTFRSVHCLGCKNSLYLISSGMIMLWFELENLL